MRLLLISCSGLLVVVFAPVVAIATAQQGDILVADGEKQWIQTYPLELFLAEHPDKRPESEIISTALWRRYVAYWELSDERLILSDIRVNRDVGQGDGMEIELHSVMSDLFPDGPVFAEWFTGYVIAPQGECLEYVHLGCASTFESYVVYSIRNGSQTDRRRMTAKEFRKFRKSQFRHYQLTDEYATTFEEVRDPGETEKEIRQFLFDVDSCSYTSMMFEEHQ